MVIINKKTKEILSYVGLTTSIISGILLAILSTPLNGDGTSPIFGNYGGANGTALAFFILFMLSLIGLGWVLFIFTKAWSIRKVKAVMCEWSRWDELNKIHGVIPTMMNTVSEMDQLNAQEAKKKQKEYIKMLDDAWQNEKKLNIEEDENILAKLKELELLKEDLKELNEYKAEKAKIEEELKKEGKK